MRESEPPTGSLQSPRHTIGDPVLLDHTPMKAILRTIFAVVLSCAAGAASAERVYVKARGEVDLAPFTCQNVSKSVNVKRICYDEHEKYVLVSLKGIWYHFCGVSPATVSDWKKSPSKGRYYNDTIRPGFECSEATAPAYR